MNDVNIYVETDTRSPRARTGHYAFVLEMETKSGIQTATEIGCMENVTAKRLVLAATYQAMARINGRCRVTIYTDSDYLQTAFLQDWLHGWQERGGKNAKGQDIKNADLWSRILYMADDYQIEIIKGPAHSYSRWLQAEMKKTDIMPGHCRTIKPDK